MTHCNLRKYRFTVQSRKQRDRPELSQADTVRLLSEWIEVADATLWYHAH